MSLSKRKSRKIVVDNDEYRWSPSQDSGYMVLTVQHASGRGRKIEVAITDHRHVTVRDGRYLLEVADGHKLAITPSLVQKVIQDALELGWSPTEEGRPMSLYLDASTMSIRERSQV